MEKVVRCASPAHRLLERPQPFSVQYPSEQRPGRFFFNVHCVWQNGANAKLPSTQYTDLPRPARLLLPEHSRCTSRCAVGAPVARNNWFPSNPSTEKSAKKGRSPRKTLRRAPPTSCDTSGSRRALSYRLRRRSFCCWQRVVSTAGPNRHHWVATVSNSSS